MHIIVRRISSQRLRHSGFVEIPHFLLLFCKAYSKEYLSILSQQGRALRWHKFHEFLNNYIQTFVYIFLAKWQPNLSERSNPDTENLANLPELLLLGGGIPLYHNGKVIGAVGIAGGGSPENDDLIGRSMSIPQADIIAR